MKNILSLSSVHFFIIRLSPTTFFETLATTPNNTSFDCLMFLEKRQIPNIFSLWSYLSNNDDMMNRLSSEWRKTKIQLTSNIGPSVLYSLYFIQVIQVRRTRHAGHCLRSKDELISDVLLWTPAYGQAKAGRPARTYIQQLCEDTGCNPEDLLKAMNDREKWRERVRGIRSGGTTWWWWWW